MIINFGLWQFKPSDRPMQNFTPEITDDAKYDLKLTERSTGWVSSL